MTKRGRLTIWFALIGFMIAAIIYVATAFVPFSKSPSSIMIVLGLIAIILCPPSLLSIPAFDIEPYTGAGFLLWSVIGMMNSAIYAGLGWLVGRFVNKISN